MMFLNDLFLQLFISLLDVLLVYNKMIYYMLKSTYNKYSV